MNLYNKDIFLSIIQDGKGKEPLSNYGNLTINEFYEKLKEARENPVKLTQEQIIEKYYSPIDCLSKYYKVDENLQVVLKDENVLPEYLQPSTISDPNLKQDAP